jgi:hypothetical protein
MDTLSFSKSNWRVGKHSKRTKNCHCQSCHPTVSSRKQSKKLVERDLEEDYWKSSAPSERRSRSAKAFIEWFYARDDDDIPMTEQVDENGEVGEGLGLDVSDEVWAEMLREHIEAEKQLERRMEHELQSARVLERVEYVEREEDWDFVSVDSLDEGFGDWEEVEAY